MIANLIRLAHPSSAAAARRLHWRRLQFAILGLVAWSIPLSALAFLVTGQRGWGDLASVAAAIAIAYRLTWKRTEADMKRMLRVYLWVAAGSFGCSMAVLRVIAYLQFGL